MQSWIRSSFQIALATLALASFGTALAQSPAPLKAGRDFQLVTPAQPTDTANKIEVLEFFSYACPHCHDFDPILTAWAKAAPKDLELRRVPVAFGREQWATLAKLYYTLEAMNELPRLHAKVFQALHQDNVSLGDEPAQLEWLEKQGIDRKKYSEIYKSFSIQSKLSRAQQLAAGYKIQGVPALAVDGKFLVSSNTAGGHKQMLSITDQVIVRARAERSKK